MPLTTIPPNSDFLTAGSQAAFKMALNTLLTELRTNGAALADCRGMKNRIINGDFRVNQRGLTSVADAAYYLDRWYALTETGNVTIAQQSDQENGSPNSLRMTQPDATAKRIGTAQAIESLNVRDLRGSAVTLSARVRCSASQAIRYAILEHTGTADSITRDVVNTWSSTNYTSGNFFIAGVNVLAVGSITPTANAWTSISLAATLGASANNVIVFVWSEGTLAQNATLDLARVQLEAGSVATAFDFRSVGTEFALCQRYYETALVRVPTAASPYNFFYRASKRVAATVAGGGAGFFLQNNSLDGFLMNQTSAADQTLAANAEL